MWPKRRRRKSWPNSKRTKFKGVLDDEQNLKSKTDSRKLLKTSLSAQLPAGGAFAQTGPSSATSSQLAAGRPAPECRLQVALILLVAGVLAGWPAFQEARAEAPPQSSAPAQTEGEWPSVQLARFGVIRGLSFGSISTSSKHESEPQVAAFLGLPYAGDPMGSLRFMPPPGRHASARTPPAQQCAARDSGEPVATRPFASFGPECVRLADWLPDGDRAHSHFARARRQLQSESCLNLNVFVPLALGRAERAAGDESPAANHPETSRSKAARGQPPAPPPPSNRSLATDDWPPADQAELGPAARGKPAPKLGKCSRVRAICASRTRVQFQQPPDQSLGQGPTAA